MPFESTFIGRKVECLSEILKAVTAPEFDGINLNIRAMVENHKSPPFLLQKVAML